MSLTVAQIEETYNVNVYGFIFMVRAVVPHMPPGGRIVNITSVSSKQGHTMNNVMCMARRRLRLIICHLCERLRYLLSSLSFPLPFPFHFHLHFETRD